MQGTKFFDFLILSTNGFFLFLIFLLSALALLSIFTLLNKREEDFGWMATLSLGLGPALMGWFFTMSLRLLPGLEPYYYIWGVVISVFALSLLNFRYIFRLGKRDIVNHFKQFTGFKMQGLIIVVLVLIGSILFALLLIGLFVPLFGNDPLEYAQSARLIADARAIDIYPFIDSSKSGGFYGPWTHPLGYVNLMSFAYLLQGGTEQAGIIKLIAPYYAFVSAIVVWGFAAKKIPLAGPLAALLLLATPIYFELSAQAHIDAMRIFTFFAAFVALYYHIKQPSVPTAIIVGIAVGMSHFTHSIGILTLPILIPLYIIVSGLSLKKLVSYLSIIIIIGVAFILPRWLENISIFGSLAADDVKVWAIPEVYFKEHLAAVRQLVTPLDKIYYGILKGISYPRQFGITYFVFIFAFIWLIVQYKPHKNIAKIYNNRQWIKPDVTVFSLWVLAGFYAIVTLSAILGMDLIIKNSRYILTVQPFIAVAIACIIADFINEKAKFKNHEVEK